MNKTIKIIKNPRITEKASDLMADRNAYVFDVAQNASKKEISEAVFNIYKLKPIKVNILPVPRKKVFSRGKSGMKRGGKKAVVYLKEEDKIEVL